MFTFTQCDDNTESIGSSIIPGNDIISAETKTYYATSRSILANDSILANTSDVYLGKYTDEESGCVFTSSFISQFACSENFEFPEEGVDGDSATGTTLRLYFDKYYGDSLNALQCKVYELDNTLQEGTPYYTNLEPEDFYNNDKEPLATKTFNVIDYTLHDTILNSEYAKHVEIRLPNHIGNRFIRMFYEEGGKSHFANSENFINDVFKGVYVKCTSGDGTLLKIYRARLDIGFNRCIESSTGKKDSIQALVATFYSGKEVLQTNKFDNNDLSPLLEQTAYSYIKTPAGIFTEVTLPVLETIEDNDTINSAKIIFTRYNENNSSNAPHKTLLMVRKKNMHRFFLKNDLADNRNAYLTSFTSSNNQYVLSNIGEVLKSCYI